MKTCCFIFLLCGILTVSGSAQETHKVQPNQTLWSIARLHGISVDELKAWNSLTSDTVYNGQILVVQPRPVNKTTNPGLTPFLYTVHGGDSLSELSQRYDISMDDLRGLNGFTDDSLSVGQRIFVRKPIGITFYTVQQGDSLGLISVRFDIDKATLRAINQLNADSVYPGQVLRVFKPAETPLTHVVAANDTLPGIAALYNTTPSALRRLNNLSNDDLTPGQVLRLKTFASASTPAVFESEKNGPKPAAKLSDPAAQPRRFYEVQRGDTLYGIARSNGLKVQDLMKWNNLDQTSRLAVGQKLDLGASAAASSAEDLSEPGQDLPSASGPVAFPDETPATPASLSAPAAPPATTAPTPTISRLGERYVILDPKIPVFEWNGDYYYWTHPGIVSQPNRGYFENNWPSPLDAYRKSRVIWEKFASMVSQKPPLSHKLDGWAVVLDPGHGGLDPGTIVKTPGPNGTSLYITEAQYVYDIALRMYELLVRNGARVETTTLAPNHLILDTNSADSTLINEKNMVYNDLILNQSDDNEAWPQGSMRGLEKRVEIADAFFRGTAPGKRIFVSLHADNNPGVPVGTGIYTYAGRDGTTDEVSKQFADRMAAFLGGGSYTRAEPLIVLRKNPADVKMLIEVHNLAIPDQAWQMRFGKTRENDARTLVDAILKGIR